MSAGPIQVYGRNVYGVAKFYPANDSAAMLAKMLRQITLTQIDLMRAKELGLTIERVADPRMLNAMEFFA